MIHRTAALLAGLIVASACSGDAPSATVPVFDVGPSLGYVANGGTHAAVPMSGAENVPALDTRARGTATFRFSDDGLSISYRLIVANISNVVQSHIHLGPPGQNGPVVVFLYGPAAPGGGRESGVIAAGVITAANFVGPLAGQPLSTLAEAIRAGGAYVNVHTNDGVAPTDTGPGDFPGGEIRGQLD